MKLLIYIKRNLINKINRIINIYKKMFYLRVLKDIFFIILQ